MPYSSIVKFVLVCLAAAGAPLPGAFSAANAAEPKAQDKTSGDVFTQTLQALLKQQREYLTRIPTREQSRSCTARYEQIWQDRQLLIDWYYGYLDAGKIVVDEPYRREMIRALRKPCTANFSGACGFRLHADQSATYGPITLIKSAGKGRSVAIRLWNSSVHFENSRNTFGIGRLATPTLEQSKKTSFVWRYFASSIKTADVIIYSGHSRVGSGPGFGPYNYGSMVVGQLTKQNWNRVLNLLGNSEKRPQLMMFSSCSSQGYYLPKLNRLYPQMALAGTERDQTFGAGEQVAYSLVDSLVEGRCGSELNRSLKAVGEKIDGGMQIFNF